MKRKLWLSILLILTALCCLFTATACKKDKEDESSSLGGKDHVHAFREIEVPISETEGYYLYECDCGYSYKGDSYMKADVCKHTDYSEWQSLGDGTHVKYCKNCGEGVTESCHGGTATCKDRAVCSVCHEPYGDFGDHKLSKELHYDEGGHYRECSCGYQADFQPHDFEKGELYDDWQCNEKGHWHKCSCGYKENVREHISSGAATEESDEYCVECKYVITPAYGHLCSLHLEKRDRVEPTCTTEGNIEYYVCDCKKIYADEQATKEIDEKDCILPLVGHNWVRSTEWWSLKLSATCTEPAVYYVSCSDCHQNKEDETFTDGTALGHKYSNVSYVWASDNSKLTAKRSCQRDRCSYVEEETAIAKIQITQEQSCTDEELSTFTCTFENPAFETKILTDRITKPAKGHEWEEPFYNWNLNIEAFVDGNPEVLAYCDCKNCDYSHNEFGNITSKVVTKHATCTDAEISTFTATFNDPLFTTQIKEGVVSAEKLGHDWEVATYVWSADNTEVTATHVCKRDCTHTETETAKWSWHDVTQHRSCTNDELSTVYAYFNNSCFDTQSKENVKTGDKHGHYYCEATYVWSSDNKTVTARRVCQYDSNHVETEIVNTSSNVTQTQSCIDNELTTYTATFKNPAFETQTKANVITKKAHGHSYGEATYTWTGYSKVTAKRVCSHDSSHIETETVNTSSKVTQHQSCTANELTTYTATFQKAAFATQTKENVVTKTAHGHSYGVATYTWTGYSKVTATRVCSHDSSHIETENVNTASNVTQSQSCTKDELTTYTATFKNPAFTIQTKENVVTKTAHGHSYTDYVSDNNATCEVNGTKTAVCDYSDCNETKTITDENTALGHDWKEVTYVWAEDNSTVTATRVCKRNGNHVETETVYTLSNVTQNQSCTKDELTTYTATFKNPAFTIQTKENVVTKTAHGHSYTDYVSDNNATCEVNGTKTAVCDYSDCNETKTITDENTALGHDWKVTTYVWAEDNSTVTATRVCKRNGNHVETETVYTSSNVTQHQSCTANELTTYTATFKNPAFKTQTKPNVVTKTAHGHSYGEATYTWTGYSEVTAKRVCSHDSSHIETEKVNTASNVTQSQSCTKDELTTYTATFKNPAFETQTKANVVTKTAHGHSYGVTTYTWTDYSKVTATRVCSHDSSHIETETVDTTSKVTQHQSCTANELTTYTATFQKAAFETQIKENVVTKTAHGHSYTDYVSDNNATCEEDGTKTAVCDYSCGEKKTITDENTALGHDWQVIYVWSTDNLSVTATRVCKNDNKHVETETVNTIITVTQELSCENDELTTYTATFTKSAFTTQIKENVKTADKLGTLELIYTEYTTDDSRYWYVSGIDSSYEGRVIIPAVHDGSPVTGIDKNAFKDNLSITFVEIGANISYIGDSAFSGCTSVTEIYYDAISCEDLNSDSTIFYNVGSEEGVKVTIGKNVTKIPAYLFSSNADDCVSKITEIIFEEESNCMTIGTYAFAYCTKLTSIVIPDSVVKIGTAVFSGCSSLKEMTIPFVGSEAGKTSKDTYQYPFGYIFGTNSYEGGMKTLQWYIGSSVASRTRSDYYIPNNLNNVVVTGGNILYGAFYNCSGFTSIIIPDTATSIGQYAFYNCSGLTGIIFSENLTFIGQYAFYNCSGLTSITFPIGLRSFGDDAFDNCSGIESLAVDENNKNLHSEGNCIITSSNTLILGCKNSIIPEYVNSIDRGAFFGCEGITNLIIPESVTSIGFEAFLGCTGLLNITLGDNLTNIGQLAFSGCSSLKGITIPEGVKDISFNTFSGCSKLEYVVLPKSITKIYADAFRNCSALKSIALPDITSIDGGVFYGCSGLTSITIPDSITLIGGNAFYGCSGLTSIAIPNGVTSIGGNAFYGCSGLTSITIPDSVTSIGDYAFYGCSGLTSIEIPDNVTSIGNYVFYGCSGLASIEIPDNVISIGDYAFYGCSGLTSIEISDNVTSIGNYVFYGCSGLTSIEISDNVTSIGYNAFYGCSGLTSITIPENVISIGSSAFSGCSALISVSMGDSVTTIGYSAFSNCTALTTLTIGNNVTSIGFDVFDRCPNLSYNEYANAYYLGNDDNPFVILIKVKDKSLSTYTINENTKIIYDSAFSGCSNLTSIEIPDNVTSIGNSAFYSCSNLTSVTIGSNVSSIAQAFVNCKKLIEVYNKSLLTITLGSIDNGYIAYYAKNIYTPMEGVKKLSVDGNGFIIYADNDDKILVGYTGTETELVLPSNVTEIYYNAFYGCNNLISVTIPESVTMIGVQAFANCHYLDNVIIGDGVTTISEYAFHGCNRLTTVVMGNNVAAIEKNAFYRCEILSIMIPKSVTSIGDYAFEGSALKQVYYSGTAKGWPTIAINSSANSKLTNATIYYYSEEAPEGEGNYWHYDENGDIAVWDVTA